MTQGPLGANEIVDVLMRKYGLLRQEIGLHLGFYKSHVRNFQFMATAIFAGGGYIWAHPDLMPNGTTWWWWWLAVTIIPIIGNYLLLDIIESQYAVALISARLATIEGTINAIAGRTVLVWESEAVPVFWTNAMPIRGSLNPDWLLSFFGLLVAFVVAEVIPIALYWWLGHVDMAWNCEGRRIAIIGGSVFASLWLGLSIMSMQGALHARLTAKARVFFSKLLERANGHQESSAGSP